MSKLTVTDFLPFFNDAEIRATYGALGDCCNCIAQAVGERLKSEDRKLRGSSVPRTATQRATRPTRCIRTYFGPDM